MAPRSPESLPLAPAGELCAAGGCHCGGVRFEALIPADARLFDCDCSMCARHLFCRVCGVKSFYVPRSNPEGVSVNARCLDAPLAHLLVVPFNGKDWERSVHLVEGLA